MTAAEKRQKVADKYKTIIGRNRYSQSKRQYCYTKAPDGKYYSDCSSSVCYTYKECGMGFGILNTVGIYNSSKLVDVPVTIKSGIIQNPTVLRVGDMLLFAGTDSSRASAGYVGHVEMVYKISSTGAVTICGHGSGTPRTTELNAYCRSRYASKTGTKLGNRGLIRVRRLIVDDDPKPTGDDEVRITGGTVNVRSAPGTTGKVLGVVGKGDTLPYQGESKTVDGREWYLVEYQRTNAWVSGRYAEVI